MEVKDLKKSLDDLQTVLSEKSEKLFEEVNKRLKEERETNDELLKAKADGHALSELQEKLSNLEKATNAEIITQPIKILKATTGNYAGMIGAALLALGGK